MAKERGLGARRHPDWVTTRPPFSFQMLAVEQDGGLQERGPLAGG
jgi:hypothetical protein